MTGNATLDKMVRKGLSVRYNFSREVTEERCSPSDTWIKQTANSRMGMCIQSEKRSGGRRDDSGFYLICDRSHWKVLYRGSDSRLTFKKVYFGQRR